MLYKKKNMLLLSQILTHRVNCHIKFTYLVITTSWIPLTISEIGSMKL